jgi:outer membrane protein assembly factor BamA
MLALMLTLMMAPQAPSLEPTRTEELQRAREQKAQQLQTPRRSFLEKGLHEFKEQRVMERFQAGFAGFHPLVGGIKPGSGFALGTAFDISKQLKASAQVSMKGYQKYEVAYATPHFLTNHVFAEVRATYRDLPEETFYGRGNNTRSEDEAIYGLKDRSVAGQIGINVRKHVKVGGQLGWIDTTASEGTRTVLPSVLDNFSASSLPGFDNTPAYLRTGAIVDVDYRDEPGNPRAGARYTARVSSFKDLDLSLHDFTQYDFDVQQYIPFFNQRRVIALRARTTLTRTADSEAIPFYMLPTIGGSDDVRGFEDFRFRDRNAVALNAEYRWEAFSGMDVALFADAGQVAARVSDMSLRDMKTAAGFGFRFNTAKKVFYRVDVGFSREGTRIYMKFGNVF